jgi:hypothetical protein
MPIPIHKLRHEKRAYDKMADMLLSAEAQDRKGKLPYGIILKAVRRAMRGQFTNEEITTFNDVISAVTEEIVLIEDERKYGERENDD